MNTLRCCLLLLVFLASNTASAADASSSARLIEEIRQQARSLDDLLAETMRTVVQLDAGGLSTRKVEPLEREPLVPFLAHVLNMPEEMVRENFVSRRHDLSQILFARFVSDQTGEPYESVLQSQPLLYWLKALQKSDVQLDRVREALEILETEISFRTLDAGVQTGTASGQSE